jgi:hypothetical protein
MEFIVPRPACRSNHSSSAQHAFGTRYAPACTEVTISGVDASLDPFPVVMFHSRNIFSPIENPIYPLIQ